MVWSVQQGPFVAQGNAPHSHPIDCDHTGIKISNFQVSYVPAVMTESVE